MKKYLIALLFIIPFTSYGAILETGVGSASVYVKTGASAGVGGDYISTVSPFSDDDYSWACWYLSGSSAECSGYHSHDIGASITDGSYVFTDTTTDPDTTFTLYVCETVWQLTSCEEESPPGITEASTTVNIIINTVEAVFFPAFFFLILFGIIIFYFKRR